MTSPERAGALQEPDEAVQARWVAREQVMGAPCRCPQEPEQEAYLCVVCTDEILSRLVQAAQVSALESVAKEVANAWHDARDRGEDPIDAYVEAIQAIADARERLRAGSPEQAKEKAE